MAREKVNLSEFIPDKNNANLGSERGQQMIRDSLQEDGTGRSIVVDANNNVVAGNKTLDSALKAGIDKAIVVETNGEELVVVRRKDWNLYSDEAPRRYAYRDNRSSEVSLNWNPEQILADVNKGMNLDHLFFKDELGEILASLKTNEPIKDAVPQIDKAEELRQEYGVELEQVWGLGDHRLVCGDCTDKEVAERVMGGEKAEMVWTDPPYGVHIGDKNKFLNSIARSNRVEENLTNDTLSEFELNKMLCDSFDNAIAVCTMGGAWYVAAPPGPLHILFGQVLKNRGIWRQTIQWVKNNATFSPMGVDYHWQVEPIFYGWLPGKAHRYYGGRKQTTVWKIDRPLKSPEHPTMKPVKLIERSIENSSKQTQIIFDPFLGSGTTLIACEQLNRQCRAIEINPGYCAVAIHRWVEATGKEPRLI